MRALPRVHRGCRWGDWIRRFVPQASGRLDLGATDLAKRLRLDRGRRSRGWGARACHWHQSQCLEHTRENGGRAARGIRATSWRRGRGRRAQPASEPGLQAWDGAQAHSSPHARFPLSWHLRGGVDLGPQSPLHAAGEPSRHRAGYPTANLRGHGSVSGDGGRAVTVNQSPLLGRPGAMWLRGACCRSACT